MEDRETSEVVVVFLIFVNMKTILEKMLQLFQSSKAEDNDKKTINIFF